MSAGREADILTAVKSLWDANATLKELVPGGLHEGRVPEEPKTPYASVKVAEGDMERTSDTTWDMRHYALSFMVWNAGGVGAVDAGRIKHAITLAFSEDRPELLQIHDARVIWLKYVPGELREDEVQKDGGDVYLGGLMYDLLLQVFRR